MASTRNNNTRCNYKLEQNSNNRAINHNLFENSSSGVAYNNAIPEFFYTPSHLPRQFFTHNSIDIESALRGINSSNLVDEPPLVTPIFKPITFNCFFEHSGEVIKPEKLVIEKNQRPNFN